MNSLVKCLGWIINPMLDEHVLSFYRVKMAETDMAARGLMEERQGKWDWTKIQGVQFYKITKDDN